VDTDLMETHLFSMLVKHRDVVTRVTSWGVTDGDSWLNTWPIQGRTSAPCSSTANTSPDRPSTLL
jgi:endo-1,4-beta-xylanase